MQPESRTLRYPVDASQAPLPRGRLHVQYARRFGGSAGVGPAWLLRGALLDQRDQHTTRLLPRPKGWGFRPVGGNMTAAAETAAGAVVLKFPQPVRTG